MSGPVRAYEIFNAKVSWSNCEDMRPWLIVDLRGKEFCGCFPIAGACYRGNCFEVNQGHANFKTTGLTKTCFIHYQSIIDVNVSALARHRGCLAEELLDEFKAAAGL